MKKQTLHFAAIALLLSVFVSSCSNYRYTNYGRPLDFLHAKKYKAQPQNEETVSNEETKVEEVEQVNAKEVVDVKKPEQTQELAVVPSVKKEVKSTSNESKSELKTSNNEVAATTIEEEQVIVTEESIKKEVKSNKKDIKRSFKSISNITHNTGGDDLLIIILCFLIPPLAVFLVLDIGKEFWIDLILTIVGFWVVGIIYALIVCL